MKAWGDGRGEGGGGGGKEQVVTCLVCGHRAILCVLVHEVHVAAGGGGGWVMVAPPAVPYLVARHQNLLHKDQRIGTRPVCTQGRVVDDPRPSGAGDEALQTQHQ